MSIEGNFKKNILWRKINYILTILYVLFKPYNLGHNKLWSGTNAVVELYTKGKEGYQERCMVSQRFSY